MNTTTVFRTSNNLPLVNPKVITVERKMYLVPKDATIPGGMIYRHTGGHRALDTEFVTASEGLPPIERAGEIDFYTYEKVDSPEPVLTVQGGLVLGNVRYAVEEDYMSRPVVMFLDGGTVAVSDLDAGAYVSSFAHWSDFDPNENEMIFDVIFDPEHDNAVRVAC